MIFRSRARASCYFQMIKLVFSLAVWEVVVRGGSTSTQWDCLEAGAWAASTTASYCRQSSVSCWQEGKAAHRVLRAYAWLGGGRCCGVEAEPMLTTIYLLLSWKVLTGCLLWPRGTPLRALAVI